MLKGIELQIHNYEGEWRSTAPDQSLQCMFRYIICKKVIWDTWIIDTSYQEWEGEIRQQIKNIHLGLEWSKCLSWFWKTVIDRVEIYFRFSWDLMNISRRKLERMWGKYFQDESHSRKADHQRLQKFKQWNREGTIIEKDVTETIFKVRMMRGKRSSRGEDSERMELRRHLL